jgi:hypothetical protein
VVEKESAYPNLWESQIEKEKEGAKSHSLNINYEEFPLAYRLLRFPYYQFCANIFLNDFTEVISIDG